MRLRLLRPVAAAALILLLGGCTRYGVFQDVGADPHPPTLRIISVFLVEPEPPPPPPEPPPEPPPPAGRGTGRVITFDTGGFTIRAGETIDIVQEYFDAGADIVSVHLRDRDSGLAVEIKNAPEEIDTDDDGEPDTPIGTPEFFPGVRGVIHVADGIEFDAHQAGPHRIEMWAEDSHESRSEKVEFTVNVVL